MSGDIRIKPSKIKGEILAIPSKSYAHRISICNFLAGNKSISCVQNFTSKDISVTVSCLEKVRKGERTLDCGESGSTLRFLLPLMGALGGEFEFVGHGKLMDRPNEELFSVLESYGVKVVKKDTIKISGKLSAGEYTIRGDISSQYVSGLLMALPTLNGDSRIILTTPLSSSAYVDITLEVLENYGVNIIKEKNGYYIHGNAEYKGNMVVEGDWSNSAFFLALGALCDSVTVKGLKLNSLQADKYILEILHLAGAYIQTDGEHITVEKKELNGFTFDADNCPDLVPIASVLASFANGKTFIKNIQRLRLKESDRVLSTIAMLNAFGIKAECLDNDLIIYGGQPKAGKMDSFNDHRIAMASAVIASCVDKESVITNAKAVEKSYPTFFEDLAKIGGNVYEI